MSLAPGTYVNKGLAPGTYVNKGLAPGTYSPYSSKPSKSSGGSHRSSSGGSSGLIGGDAGLRVAASNAKRSTSSGSSSGSSGGGSGGHSSSGSGGHRGSVSAWNKLFSKLGLKTRISSPSSSSGRSSSGEPKSTSSSGSSSRSLGSSERCEIEKQVEKEVKELISKGKSVEEVVETIKSKYGVDIEVKKLELPSLTKEIEKARIQEEKAEEIQSSELRKATFGGSGTPKQTNPDLEDVENKIAECIVELEYRGDRETNVVERIKIGAELAGLGITTGLINVGRGIVELSKTAVKNPIEAGKMFVIGTAEWFAKIPEKIWSGFTESPYYAGVLVGETVGGLVVGEGLRVASKPIPRPAFAKLTILEGGGAEPKLGTVRYGITIHALEKPLITIAKGEGIKVGRVVPAPKEAIEGKAVTAYSKLETEFFKKTVEEHAKSPEHAEIFELGYDITSKIYSTKEPVVKPEKFEILSEHIPEPAKPIVKEVITSYKGNIEVYGSVAQKLQMGEYMTRQPKDIEVIVDNPEKFVSELEKKLKSSGVEYKIEGSPEKPKIYFKIGEEWVKGIEVFSKKGKEGYLSIFGGKRSAIAYGFEEQKPLKVEEVELLRLSEQAARKLEGGHVFKEGEIVPKHEGRWKDVSDLIEIATAYAIEKGLPIERQLVEYAKLRVKLHGKYIESPIAKFIAEKGRLPTYEELVKITREAGVKLPELRDLLFKRERSSYLPRATDILDISYYLSPPKESYIGFSYGYDILSELSPEISSNIETSSKAKGSASQSKNERSSKPSTPSKGKSSSPKPSKPKTPSSKPKTTIGKPPSIPSKSSGGSGKPPAGISTAISTPEIPSVPSAPRSVLKRETRKQTRKSREMRRKVEWNIYNVYQNPLKVVSKAMKQIDRILKEIGL